MLHHAQILDRFIYIMFILLLGLYVCFYVFFWELGLCLLKIYDRGQYKFLIHEIITEQSLFTTYHTY